MKRTLTSIIIVIIFFIIYISAINVYCQVAIAISNNLNQDNLISFSNGNTEKVGIGESVTIGVKRVRWYGKIIENVGSNSNLSNLYLFNLTKVPLNINGLSLIKLHIFLLFFCFSIISFVFIKELRQG